MKPGQIQSAPVAELLHRGDYRSQTAGIDEFDGAQVQYDTSGPALGLASHVFFELDGHGGIDTVTMD